MRGPRPKALEIPAEHREILYKETYTPMHGWRRFQRARILLAAGRGENPCMVAEQLGCSVTTVWRVCRRYEQAGLMALEDAPRSGRPKAVAAMTRVS